LQAIDWLKATIKASGASCEVVAQHDPHFINSLELAARFGTVGQCLLNATTATHLRDGIKDACPGGAQ